MPRDIRVIAPSLVACLFALGLFSFWAHLFGPRWGTNLGDIVWVATVFGAVFGALTSVRQLIQSGGLASHSPRLEPFRRIVLLAAAVSIGVTVVSFAGFLLLLQGVRGVNMPDPFPTFSPREEYVVLTQRSPPLYRPVPRAYFMTLSATLTLFKHGFVFFLNLLYLHFLCYGPLPTARRRQPEKTPAR